MKDLHILIKLTLLFFLVYIDDLAIVCEITCILRKKLILFILPVPILTVQQELRDYYLKHICINVDKAAEINVKTLSQKGPEWNVQRRKRITASRAYPIYTYAKNKNPDWEKKFQLYINPSSIKTKAMLYGQKTESIARKAYETRTSSVVLMMRLVINPEIPWMAYSPDGYIVESDILIEIKCPLLGETAPLNEVLPTLNCLNNQKILKKNHTYYCQVQIGMALMNCNMCHFIIYCKFSNECYIIEVPIDYTFIKETVECLERSFFTYMLPKLFENDIN